jgi:hypothetical protein
MKKPPFVFVLIALALSGCGEKKLTLTEVRNPTSSLLDQTIVTQGYLSSSNDQDLLSSQNGRFADIVDLAVFPGVPKDQRFNRRQELGRRLGGKLVSVRGRLKVGPFGLGGRSTIYIEVEDIDETAPAAE